MDDLIQEILKIKNILESFSDMYFYIKDMECRYVYMTKSVEKFLGESFSAVIYEKSFFHEDLETEKDLLHGRLSNSIDVVYMNRPCDGIPVYMRFEKIPLKNKERVIGLLCAIFDVTESYSNKIMLIDLLFRKLTPSEKRYFFFISNDYTRKEIAEKMNTTIGTVDQYRYRILEKLKLKPEEFDQLKRINFEILNEIYQKNL